MDLAHGLVMEQRVAEREADIDRIGRRPPPPARKLQRFGKEGGKGAEIGGGAGTFEPRQGVAVEDFAAVGEARLQPREGVDRIGHGLAAVGPNHEGAPEQPRLAGELGGDDLAGGRAAGRGIDRPPVLQKAQRGVVVGAPYEPGGRLGVPARQQ